MTGPYSKLFSTFLALTALGTTSTTAAEEFTRGPAGPDLFPEALSSDLPAEPQTGVVAVGGALHQLAHDAAGGVALLAGRDALHVVQAGPG
ncbi:MAG: hypothetical protein KC416_14950, partial [Myxococcales bacterium]|nr:hypothetical protein [Myxococcales bacterium]